jgi:N-methylhydantoinase B
MPSEAAALPAKLAQAPGAKALEPDPITLERVRDALEASAAEMASALVRAASSTSVTEARDFSVGLFDAQGASIVQGPEDAPLACADLAPVVRKGAALLRNEDLQPGDVVVSNDAESGAGSVADMVAFSPIFAQGALAGFAAVRARWSDVGGMAVGSAPSGARDVFCEGVQLPFLKAYRAGAPDAAVLRLIRANTRFPDRVLGDLRAQAATCGVGEKRLLELIARHGRELVDACVRRIWDEAETLARRAVQAMPDGVYEAACRLDNDGVRLDRPIPLEVRIVVSGADMTIDFSGTSDEVDGPCNARAAETIARVAFKHLTTPRRPACEGAFRNLEVICPEGKLVNARASAPRGCSDLVVVSAIDLVLRALAPALSDRGSAGGAGNLGLAALSGTDSRTGRAFHGALPYLGGWGAQGSADGASAAVSLVHADVRFTSVEVQETAEPIRVRAFTLRQDSGGAGKHRGGLGVVLEREMLASCFLHGRYERSRDAPWGVAGGKPGGVTRASVRRDASESDLPMKCEYYPMQEGDVEILRTAGGGGFGAPAEREPERVRADVIEGYVSLEAARAQYGVVLDPETLEIDTQATAETRKKLRSANSRGA